ncbi:hypothetical protein RN001_013190 [Aquatica leii]|uniref:SAM domain-containing protein n=1 Tax=Aquatica leii TaxID=1421715 RepID=A0AAN7PZP3_9COLE|nr:hypothetical protein RN001_013190 [Aquatica leii]
MSVQCEETLENYNQDSSKTHVSIELRKDQALDSQKHLVDESAVMKVNSVSENSDGVINNLNNNSVNKNQLCIEQVAQFSISNSDRKRGLKSIIGELKEQYIKKYRNISQSEETSPSYGDTPSTESLDGSPQRTAKATRRRRLDRITNATTNGVTPSTPSHPADYLLYLNNNHVKNERLSPGTPDTSSRSRSVTPLSASHPDTPPAPEHPTLPQSLRNCSDIMRSLAARYNHTNPNEYFSAARNGFPPPFDPRFKLANFPNILSTLPNQNNKDAKKPDFSSILNPFSSHSAMQLIDMSSTQALLHMARTAKDAEDQRLLKTIKRQESSSPLDLSAGATPMKRPRTKTPSSGSLSGGNVVIKRADSESPKLQEDVSNWTVDDVCNFVSGIDICAEYTKNFREQQIDGSGLPLLTEEHLTTTMSMKLGPALKLKSMLAKKLGSCSICLHCTHCHRNSTGSPDPGNITGNTSDSGGVS